MVRDVFRLAREQAPSIVFIDEIDSIATKRFDAQTGMCPLSRLAALIAVQVRIGRFSVSYWSCLTRWMALTKTLL